MDSIQVRIRLECAKKNDALINRVISIRLLTEENTYIFPTIYQDAEHHLELFNIGIIKNACKSLTKVGHYRNISVKLPPEVVPLYFDECFNYIFKDLYLEEIKGNQPSPSTTLTSSPNLESQLELVKLVEKLTARLEAKENKPFNISNVYKQFVLEQYEVKENANDWMYCFEQECDRLEINTNEQKIRILRLFLEESAKEWYKSTLCKLTLQSDWKLWRESFLQTYSDKSWRSVHYAYTFKFINGSLLDYALIKERLLLQTEPTMSDTSRINHIVIGLPFYIQDRLDKEEIVSTEQLMNQLRRYAQAYPKAKTSEAKHLSIKTDNRPPERKKFLDKPSNHILDSRSYSGRPHQPDFYKNKGTLEGRRVNLSEADLTDTIVQNEEKKRGCTPLIRLNVTVNKNKVTGVYDSGSNITLINYKLIQDIKDKMLKDEQIFKTISGVQKSFNKIKLMMKIHKIEHEIEFHVIKNDNFSYDVLLGLDAIQKFRLLQDEKLNILQRVKDNKLEQLPNLKGKQTAQLNYSEEETFNYLEKLKHLKRDEINKLSGVLNKNLRIFAKHRYDVGLVQNHEAHIKLLETKYISKKPYRCSIPDRQEIENQITKLLEQGLIEESSSPFGAPVTLAYKKEEGRRSRLCIDFRELNKILVPESQPFPRIEDIVVKTRNCKWYSVLDISSAFWSIPVRLKDRHKTAFVTQSGHYQWTRLPFGLKISPSIFQRVLANAIRSHGLQDFCINYIDDILVFSASFNEHLCHLAAILKAISLEGYRLKLSKCHFAQSSVKYLGHVLSHNTVRPHHDNLRSIKGFPKPQNKKNIRQFLGKINFYHKYIPDYTRLLEPLHNLLRNNTEFKWTDECNETFTTIKEYLCQSPILAIFDPEKTTFLFSDASILGVGAVLKQTQDNGELHPVAYFSKKFSPAQARKKAIYLECLAIKEAIRYWQHWLLGHKFMVISDHKPLENLKVKARTDEELGDLVYYLSQYDFSIRYSPGRTNQEADALSRNPVLECFENQDDILQLVNLIAIEDLKRDQRSNPNHFSEDKNTSLKGDIIYKKLRGRERIYVSKDFGLSIIKKVHSYYGHIGVGHMAAKIRPFYYFRQMDKLIREFCNRCDTCKVNKTRRSRGIGKLSQLGPAIEPYEIMSLDTIGGFAGNRSSKRYLHLLVDHFTRYAYTYTSSGQSTNDFIKFLRPILKKNKVKLLLADQYSGINSKEFKTFLKNYGVNLIFTAIDCAFSNGLNERLNQTLVNRIRCKISEHRDRPWTSIAVECTQEYNRTTHSVTKFSPLYLLTGQSSSIIPPTLETSNDLATDRLEAFKNSTKSHNSNKVRVDKTKKVYDFQAGDLVYVESGSRLNRNKLDPVRTGPFEVLRRVSPTMYQINCRRRRSQANFVHSSMLLPFRGGEM